MTRMGHSPWRVGQAAKTPPFHGGNTGSIPVRVTTTGEESLPPFGGLAQLVRAPASHAGGHWFESSSLHQKHPISKEIGCFYFFYWLSCPKHRLQRPLKHGILPIELGLLAAYPPAARIDQDAAAHFRPDFRAIRTHTEEADKQPALFKEEQYMEILRSSAMRIVTALQAAINHNTTLYDLRQ